MIHRAPTIVLALLLIGPLAISAQTSADPELLTEINNIKALDNHAHPLRHVAEGEKPDDEYDALPLDAIGLFPLPVRTAPTNPEFIRAWKQLYSYNYNDMSESHVQELLAVKKRVLSQQGQNFPAWVLDQLN